jgi:hypothetical protein
MLSPSIVSAHGVSPFASSQADLDNSSGYPQSSMRVRKRNGGSEPVNVNKIVRAVNRCCVGLPDVDALRVATKTISGLYDGATTRELDQLSIQTAAGLIAEEPQYAKLAAHLLAGYIEKEVRGQEIHAFSQSVAQGHELGLINERLAEFVRDTEAPEDSPSDRDAAAILPAYCLRFVGERERRARAVSSIFVARVRAELAHAVQFGHAARTALELLLARLT